MKKLESILSQNTLLTRLTPWLTCLSAGVAACIFAYFAGSASQNVAFWAVQAGGVPFLREPINAGLALLLILMWQRWRPLARYASPKWGQVAIGLAIGLCFGIVLPALALALLAVTGHASFKPLEIDPIVLVVPFIFLILHGFAEEGVIRTIAQREGHHYFGAIGGVLLAAISFCVLQSLQGYWGLWYCLNSLLFGTCLGLLALGPGGIWTAVGAHAGWTWLETALLGGPGQIVKSQSWLSGVGADSYGSPAFSVVLILVVGAQLALHLRGKKRKG
jgi:membrane protease YdiL (CAAX protease family)